MGIETAGLVMLAVATGATVGKMGFEISSANAREEALNLQAKEGQLQYQQKALSNLDSVQKVLDAQEAALTTRGVAFSSPSFNAIQRATLNISAKQQKNAEIESNLYQTNIDMEKQNVRSSLFAQLFGDTANLAMGAVNVASKLPKMEE